MLTFNAILRHEGIDPNGVRLVRHQDTRGRLTPYNLWLARDGRLELYQRIQTNPVFSDGDLLASFVVTPNGQTLFVGLYFVTARGAAPLGLMDPIHDFDTGRKGLLLYDIRPDNRLVEYAGHLTIEWGKAYRKWVQRAHKQDKPVVEIRQDIVEPPFPGFSRFCWDLSEITAIPLTWQAVLRSVKGVYLLVCKETGKQYVGSAKGEDSLWGRFCEYAADGHGGNLELKRRGPKAYQVSVLEIVNSDVDIESLEGAWKQRLLTRKFGLNEN